MNQLPPTATTMTVRTCGTYYHGVCA